MSTVIDSRAHRSHFPPLWGQQMRSHLDDAGERGLAGDPDAFVRVMTLLRARGLTTPSPFGPAYDVLDPSWVHDPELLGQLNPGQYEVTTDPWTELFDTDDDGWDSEAFFERVRLDRWSSEALPMRTEK